MRTEVSRLSWLRWLPIALAAFGLLLSTQPCSASLSFPKRLKARWGITGTLPAGGEDGCLVCHTKEVGGAGTATRSFAQTLRIKYSLAPGDIDTLDYALDQAEKNADDSDRDGFSDYDELAVHGTNPSDAKSRPAIAAGTGGAPATGGATSAGGASAAGGASSASGAAGSPEPEELSQCTPSGPVFPIPAYGCQFQPRASRGFALLATMLALSCLILHRARARTRRSTRSGAGRWF